MAWYISVSKPSDVFQFSRSPSVLRKCGDARTYMQVNVRTGTRLGSLPGSTFSLVCSAFDGPWKKLHRGPQPRSHQCHVVVTSVNIFPTANVTWSLRSLLAREFSSCFNSFGSDDQEVNSHSSVCDIYPVGKRKGCITPSRVPRASLWCSRSIGSSLGWCV